MRVQAIEYGLLQVVLDRLSLVSGEKPRTKVEETDLEDEIDVSEMNAPALVRKSTSQQDADRKKARTQSKGLAGVGYSRDLGVQFDVTKYLKNAEERNNQIKILVDICTNFLDTDQWQATEEICDLLLQTSIVPLLESAYRCASFLEISKQHELYNSYLSLTQAICKQEHLLPLLIDIKKCYVPVQTAPICQLLEKVNELGKIFLTCLKETDDDASK